MNADTQQGNHLNRLRRERPGALQEEWTHLCQTDIKSALRLINDPKLEFPALFTLKDQLEERGAVLNPRNRIALAHIRNVLQGADLGIDTNAPFPDQHDLVVGSLLWILRTGWKNILSTDYAQVIDLTAIHILHTYHQDWTKEMIDLIFYRYKNKSQRHYLISALLETANPACLVYLANYLLSDQTVESDYARRMLSFIPEVRHTLDCKSAFFVFETWYEENGHYLVYTGETNDAVPGGRPYRIHYSAKYLGKAVMPRNGEPIQTLLPEEKRSYLAFLKLPRKTQIALSNFSAQLRKRQPRNWRFWIAQPLNQQIGSLRERRYGGEGA
ncbi:hypothetical protein [Sporolactobacillus putidus]|uniref:Uncharacterized protein n=1 Tax=Sporolactobacillus putidus TaxID=492735 RepID=A0A917S755_9BACL|nr:hypothetical protein [Sporolactobacillus putidus]GGL62526.1 hypothetical protein GCM10007968_28160 [Sporolactobacillus putidus]